MTVRACLIIPVYNHPDTVGPTVEAVSHYGLSIYLVDDGSDRATQDRLMRIAASVPSVRLLRLPYNHGKGAAVMCALRQAGRDGFTHALQIDADGQHDTNDIPRFLAAAAANPRAVICGQPIYDRSIPKARLYGRYLTHFWVWVETLSFAVKDSMCGFRLYPLELTSQVIDREDIPQRMDFDPAILVHLIWAGAPVVNVPTRVIYPRDGVSHFDMWRDNLRISRMHATLVFGMLLRLPTLLARKVRGEGASLSPHWARLSERGSYIGLSIVLYCYRIFGRTMARALLYPITAYFFLTYASGRRASLDYLNRLYAYTGPTPALPRAPGWRESWRHFMSFAQASLDKIAAWAGDAQRLPVDFPNRAQLDELVASGRGAILIGAHFGNWEMSRAIGYFTGYRRINAVVYTEHARRFNRTLTRANKDFEVNLIPVSNIGPETAVLLQQKIDGGGLLVIVGDRTPPGDNGRVVRASFLGAEAPFPQGPFILAALLGCPVYFFLCVRDGGQYRVHFERFADRVVLPRATREQALQGYAQRYAEQLEQHCRQAPFEWFNFFDFWAGAPPIHKDSSLKAVSHEFGETRGA